MTSIQIPNPSLISERPPSQSRAPSSSDSLSECVHLETVLEYNRRPSVSLDSFGEYLLPGELVW